MMTAPGSPNPLLWGGGDPLDELGKIERSVRLRAAATAYMSRTFGAPTANKKFTFSVWVKRGRLSSNSTLLSGGTGSTNTQHLMLGQGGSDQVRQYLNNGTAYDLYSNALFRDVIGHEHFVFIYDSASATAALRERIFVDGIEVSSFASAGYIPQNAASIINAAGTVYLGRNYGGDYFDGQIAFPAFVDGQALLPSAFAQTHPRTGQWRPRSKPAIRAAVAVGGGARNGWGANGCFLPFDDPTSLTTLGYDRSQSDTDTTGNNWTATNISLTAGATYDSMLDSPTSNFCTSNPLDRAGSLTFSNANLRVDAVTSANGGCRGTQAIQKPLYFEAEWAASGGAGYSYVGIAALSDPSTNLAPASGISLNAKQWAWRNDAQKMSNGAISAYGSSLVGGDIACFFFDPDTTSLWAGKVVGGVATWFGSGDPESGLNPMFNNVGTGEPYRCAPFVGHFGQAVNQPGWSLNFGQRSFAATSGIPSRAKLLSTKNLPYPPIPKSEAAFVARTDTGANIQTSLAAARAGWADYIEIFKRRDAAEGWRWRFSDDSANYLDSSSTAAKAAFPSLSGTSYVGYALKVSAANGVATGTFVHTNGAASVINDGLANSRKMVILHRESAGGGAWPAYHPDCTAGKLVYLNTSGIETTNASINSVTASGFTADASLPSGTYRWIAIAETDGFSQLWKYTGNASGDGPFVNCNHQPALLCAKNLDNGTTGNWVEHDTARDTKNVMTVDLYFNSSGSEITSPNFDAVSNGVKGRWNSSAEPNVSSNRYIGFSFAAFPFRYANAR